MDHSCEPHKMRRPHRIPLAPRTVAILERDYRENWEQAFRQRFESDWEMAEAYRPDACIKVEFLPSGNSLCGLCTQGRALSVFSDSGRAGERTPGKSNSYRPVTH